MLLNQITNTVNKKLSTNLGCLLSKPFQISLNITYRCNAKCQMCTCWKEKNDYLDKNEILTMINQLHNWIGSGFFLNISGGEPLIYKQIFEVFKHCNDLGIFCKLSTNGLAFTENTLNKILESQLPYLSVSLDSHKPSLHDKIRGVEGMFNKAINGIKYLSNNGDIKIGVASVLMKDNLSTFADSVRFFLDLPINRYLFQPIRSYNLPKDRWPEYEYWINDQVGLSQLSEQLLSIKHLDSRFFNSINDIVGLEAYFMNSAETQIKRCTIGYEKLNISHTGDVFLGCTHYGSIGNIKNGKIRDLWHSEKAKRIREKMLTCSIPCTSNCSKELSAFEKLQRFYHIRFATQAKQAIKS